MDPNPVRLDETYPYSYQPPPHHPSSIYPVPQTPLLETSYLSAPAVPPLSFPLPPSSPNYRVVRQENSDRGEFITAPRPASLATAPLPYHISSPSLLTTPPSPPRQNSHIHLSNKATKKLENSLKDKLQQQRQYEPQHVTDGYITPPLSPQLSYTNSPSTTPPPYRSTRPRPHTLSSTPSLPTASPALSLRQPSNPTLPPANPPSFISPRRPLSPSPPHTPLYNLPSEPTVTRYRTYSSSGRPNYTYDDHRAAMADLTFRTTYQQAFTPPKIPQYPKTASNKEKTKQEKNILVLVDSCYKI